jgi:hypothetical protein
VQKPKRYQSSFISALKRIFFQGFEIFNTPKSIASPPRTSTGLRLPRRELELAVVFKQPDRAQTEAQLGKTVEEYAQTASKLAD